VRRDDGRLKIRKGRRKEETEERRRSLARESRESFSRILLADSTFERLQSVHKIPRSDGSLPGPPRGDEFCDREGTKK